MKRISMMLVLAMLLMTLASCMPDVSGGNYTGSGGQTSTDNGQSGTSNNNSNDTNGGGEGTMELTQRQQTILAQQNLPTKYDLLNDSQKKAIIAIEEMFCYLDKKYVNVSFEFKGYRAPSALDKEALIVQPKGETYAENVTVIRENGVCGDDYATVDYRDEYEAMIKTKVKESFPRAEVFSDLDEVDDNADPKDLRASVSAVTGIYVIEADAEGKDLQDIAKKFGEWYAEGANGKSCSFSIYVVPEDVYWSITRLNRTNYDKKVIQKLNITVRANGSVIVR